MTGDPVPSLQCGPSWGYQVSILQLSAAILGRRRVLLEVMVSRAGGLEGSVYSLGGAADGGVDDDRGWCR